MTSFLKNFGKFQFWAWNLLAVIIFTYLLGVLVLPYILMAAITGEMPPSIFLSCLLLILLPFVSIILAARRPDIIVPYFFGVQLPLIFLAFLRMAVFRELTFGSGLMLTTGFMAGGVFTWTLFKSNPDEPLDLTRPRSTWQTILLAFVLIVGAFVALLGFLYAVPVLIATIKGILSFDWLFLFTYPEFYAVIPFVLIFFLTGVAFFFFPFYVAYYYPRSWWRWRGSRAQTYVAVSAMVALVWGGLHIYASNTGTFVTQFAKLEGQERQDVYDRPEKYRKQLMRAYLHEYRYLGTRDYQNNLESFYDEALWDGNPFGPVAQDIQSALFWPVIYGGVSGDKAKAAEIYSDIFDTPIQRAERKTIAKSLEATFHRDEVEAGLMNIGIKNVEIAHQDIRIQDQGDYAIVDIAESYRNLTRTPQEIFYYFSLPEDAVVTGVWIGRTSNRSDMDHFIVAPRGAAQQVYEDQVRRNIDPALLEQVGPGQYRLRVFPIPVTLWRAFDVNFDRRGNRIERDKSLMNLHMQFVVPRSEAGFALPQLSEKRNIDWGRKTKRKLNGEHVSANDWMPKAFVPANQTGPLDLDIQLGDQTVSLSPLDTAQIPSPSGHYLLIADTSYSMRAHQDAFTEAVSDLQSWADENSPFSFHSKIDLNAPKFLGSSTYQELLNRDITALSGYDGVILLTDKGRYAHTEESPLQVVINKPLWIWHLGAAPSAMDDAILDLVYRTGGGVVGSSAHLKAGLNFPDQRVTPERIWKISETGAQRSETIDNAAVRALASRQIILQGSFGALPDLSTLDDFHRLAKTHNVVSPYSSMIVLVNDQQRQALADASEKADRFDREGRSGTEQLSSPNSPLVSGVPEPHEWLLIFLCIGGLIIVYRRREALMV